jgi:peptide/nickel transport system permease protein
MASYLTRRLIQGFLFFLLSTLAMYTAVIYMPGGPAARYTSTITYDATDPTFKDEVPQVLADYYEVNKPWPLSYLAWLFDPARTMQMDQNRKMVPVGIDVSIGEWQLRGSGVLTGDFGRVGDLISYDGVVRRGPTVTSKIADGWTNTVLVVGLAVLFSLLIAIPLGIIASARPGRPLDRAVTFMSSLVLSLPLYGLTYLLITFLAIVPYALNVQLGWSWMPRMPAGSAHSVGQEGSLLDYLYHATLPALVLAIPQIAIVSKYVRASMLEVLGLDYIRTAWAKGLPRWRIMGKHAFRNALLPTITVIGLVLPGIASGSIIVEYAFAYQGLGYLTFTALGGCVPSDDNLCTSGTGRSMDPALLMALLLILVAVITIANILADIMYMVADPRVEYAGRKSGQ